MSGTDVVVHLRSEGVSLVLDVTGGELLAVLHWGADLGPLDRAGCDALALAVGATVYPESPSPPGHRWHPWAGFRFPGSTPPAATGFGRCR